MVRRRTHKKSLGLPLLYVEWADHHANGAWQSEIDHTPATCCSVGWLIKEDGKGITLAGSKDSEGKLHGNSQYVIKSCILKRETIKV